MSKHPELHQDLNFLTPSQIPLFFGVAVFNFEGNGVVLNIHASMKSPEKFDSLIKRTITLVITLLIVFATLSYVVSFDST